MQYIFIIYGTQIGSNIFRIPNNLGEKAGTDGWITIILGYILTTITGLIIIQVMKKYPNGTILDVISHYFGKWIGKLFAVVFIIYFGIIASYVLVLSIIYLQELIFPQFSINTLLTLLYIPIFLLTKHNFRMIGRYAQLIFFMTIWFYIFFLVPLQESQIEYILPILKNGWYPVLQGVERAIYIFAGFEVVFILYPFLIEKKKASRGFIIANTLTMLTLVFVTLICLVYFSPDEITQYYYPIISLLKMMQFQFIERVDIIFTSVFLLLLSTTWVPIIYATVFSSSYLIGKKEHTGPLIIFLIVLWFSILFFPPNLKVILKFEKFVEMIIFIISYILPIFLFVFISIIRLVKKGVHR
jgi:spore germination protein (amino acid permease)